MSEHNNTNNLLSYKWAVGILITIVLGAGAGWISSVQAQIQKVPLLESQISDFKEQLTDVTKVVNSIAVTVGAPIPK